MNTPDYRERIALLKSCENSPVWQAVRMSLQDEIDECRKILESDWTPEDSGRYRHRIYLRDLQDMQDDTFLKRAILSLEGKIETLKQEAAEREKL